MDVKNRDISENLCWRAYYFIFTLHAACEV